MSRLAGDLELNQHGPVVVVTFLDRGPDEEAVRHLRDEFLGMLASPDVKQVVLDLREMVSCTGFLIGVLVRLARELQLRRGRLTIIARGSVRELLIMIRLDRILSVADNLDQALDAVSS